MRFDASSENIEKNLREFAPFFIRRVAPALVIFSFVFSLLLADCMNLPLLLGVVIGLLFAPIAYFMGVSVVLVGRAIVDITRAAPPIFVSDIGYSVRYPFLFSVFLPIPTSPPRHRLADCEALLPQG